MKDSVKHMYDQITMPESCAEAIRQAAARQNPARKKPILRPMLATAAALALIVCLSPQARAAAAGTIRHIFGRAVVVIDSHTGEVQSVLSFPTQEDSTPAADDRYVETQDGRVLFHGPEGEEDITNYISMDTPWIRTYVDANSYEHILIVGGTAENMGFSEFLRQSKPDLQPWEGWEGGSSDNYLDVKTGKAYPWLAVAWEELQLPWPMPGGGA